jgi:hypothetical protein
MAELPDPVGGCILPHDLIESRRHPDVRIARRAATIVNLAKVISERDVSVGLRISLRTQARRLLALAERRLSEVSGLPPDEQAQRGPSPLRSAVIPTVGFNDKLSRSSVSPQRGVGCAALMTLCPLRNGAQAGLPSRDPRKAVKLSRADEPHPFLSMGGRDDVPAVGRGAAKGK